MRRDPERYGSGLALALLMIIALVWLSACSVGGNQYFVRITATGDGSVTPTITNTPSKTVDTSVGVSAAATAAASQNGEASNAGASEAQTLGEKQ